MFIVPRPRHAKGVTVVPAKRSPLFPLSFTLPSVIKWFILVLALLLSLAAFHAPSFLLISEAPVRSDAVVFFVGGETGTREKEAHQLLREGFADYLLVPGQGLIKKRGPDGRLERLDLKNPMAVPNQRTKKTGLLKTPTSKSLRQSASWMTLASARPCWSAPPITCGVSS